VDGFPVHVIAAVSHSTVEGTGGNRVRRDRAHIPHTRAGRYVAGRGGHGGEGAERKKR